ncbi:hypothetical protein E9993_13590 [Labilibacter sediminis]|nr:hypothetical protein E9993_13590 [Labilibacter sediminis]
MKQVSYRPLTPVKEMIEELGFTISYPFDDLIFIDSNAFLVQFHESKENTIGIYFNHELESSMEPDLRQSIGDIANKKGIQIEMKGKFSLSPKEEVEGELEITFM